MVNKKLSKVRNQKLQLSNKLKQYDKAYGLNTEGAKNAVACDYVIDCNARGADGTKGKEPKMVK